jgi:hypothetical protein
MKVKIIIWSKLKEKDENGKSQFIINSHVTVTQEEIEQLALEKYKDGNSTLREYRTYWAEIEEVIHD